MSSPPLPVHRILAPRKKLRGGRRYFSSLRRGVGRWPLLPLESTDWWDHWHTHVDWEGWGNRSWRLRRAHLAILAAGFARVAEHRDRFSTPFQAWITIDVHDAGQDALYLHTPNPNGSAFPVIFPEAQWGGSPLAEEFARLLPTLELRWGSPVPGYWFAFAPGVGVPLDGPDVHGV